MGDRFRRGIHPWIGHAAAALTGIPLLAADVGSAPVLRSGLHGFLSEHCLDCHGRGGKVKGDFDLRTVNGPEALKSMPDLLERIDEAVRDGEMPPNKATQPPEAIRAAFLQETRRMLDESLRTHAVPPRTPVRRMNRFQYANSVKDLLDLKVEPFVLPEAIVRDLSGYFEPAAGRMPERIEVGNRILGKGQLIVPRLTGVSPFPQDPRAANGFDNRADLLALPPVLMESFLELSRSIFESSDFGPETCGNWKEYFEAPPLSGSPGNALAPRLREFLTHAFRRPVDDETLVRYASLARERFEAGDTFTASMKAAAGAALASPRFLFPVEQPARRGTARSRLARQPARSRRAGRAGRPPHERPPREAFLRRLRPPMAKNGKSRGLRAGPGAVSRLLPFRHRLARQIRQRPHDARTAPALRDGVR
jgi:hypothetical protein